MHIEFLVEELSAEAALYQLLPKILGSGATWDIHPHRGKPDLMRKLPNKLKSYARWLPTDGLIIVLVDEDRQNCILLKARLESAAKQAGLRTRSNTQSDSRIQVINRIAIEELEAWFFGDTDAIKAAYPRFPVNISRKAKYRNPDAIGGGTREALERILLRRGYFPGGLPRIEVARTIAHHMEPQRNSSRSFACFRDALVQCIDAN